MRAPSSAREGKDGGKHDEGEDRGESEADFGYPVGDTGTREKR